MRSNFILKSSALLASGLLLLTACQRGPMPTPLAQRAISPVQSLRAPQGLRSFNAAQAPLVAVQGFQTGDKLNVKGPFFTSGKGQVHNLTNDSFKIEFSIAGHHLIVDAVRIDEQKVRFTTTDVKANRTVEAIGTYTINGTTTVFDMGKGNEVEKLTVRATRPAYFETDVVQPGRLFPAADERGSNTLKFSKG